MTGQEVFQPSFFSLLFTFICFRRHLRLLASRVIQNFLPIRFSSCIRGCAHSCRRSARLSVTQVLGCGFSFFCFPDKPPLLDRPGFLSPGLGITRSLAAWRYYERLRTDSRRAAACTETDRPRLKHSAPRSATTTCYVQFSLLISCFPSPIRLFLTFFSPIFYLSLYPAFMLLDSRLKSALFASLSYRQAILDSLAQCLPNLQAAGFNVLQSFLPFLFHLF